jgi:hypothetical protein
MSRLLDTVRSIVRETFPRYDYLGPRKYRVVRMSADRVELQIVNRALGLPDILPISQWPGAAGVWAQLQPGALVLVQFIDGDPSQPIVTHYEPKGGAGFRPVEMHLCAGSTGASPTEHATSAEASVNLLASVIATLCSAIPGVWTGADVATKFVAAINTALAIAASSTIAPYAVALTAALAAKTPNTTGLVPGVGWPSVRGG